MFTGRISLVLGAALACALACPSQPANAADDFALHDGDTVVFLGDSITAERTYGKLIEQYTLLRFPERKIRFINAGKGGETAHGALERLDSAVFAHQPTVLTVAYGINDIGWGVYADDEHKEKYLQGIRTIVRRCQQRGIRVYICSAAVTGSDPEKSENDYLQRMCDEGLALARELGAGAIDVQRTMRDIQRNVFKSNHGKPEDKRDSLHAPDGVHLSSLGAVAMGYAILKGLSAPDFVSSATIDARAGEATEARGCKISDVSADGNRVAFTRLDEGLPLNQDTFFIFSNRFVPITDQLNGYFLKVTGLPPGKYLVRADEREVSVFTDSQLAAGVNIASATTDGWQPGGPWAAQANVLHYLTQARDQLALSGRLAEHHLPAASVTAEMRPEVDAANDQLESLQRRIARPQPYRFVIAPAPEKPPER